MYLILFQRRMSSDMKEEDILSLMVNTGQDREKAVRALILASGDCMVIFFVQLKN